MSNDVNLCQVMLTIHWNGAEIKQQGRTWPPLEGLQTIDLSF